MSYLIQQTLLYAVPLMIVALAGVFAERSGIINLALEGIMIFGAFIGVLFFFLCQKYQIFDARVIVEGSGPNRTRVVENIWQMQLFEMLGMLVSAVLGSVFALLLGFASINLRADQTITGTSLNMLAPALVLFFTKIIASQESLYPEGDMPGSFVIKKYMFGFSKDGGGFFVNTFLDKVYLATYICIILFVICSIILYKTRFGLRLRACGENPQAAGSLGINVYKMRYLGVIISGALAGMGGFVYALTTSNSTSTGDVAGFGFLALAVMIFGNWKPLNIAGAALLFGMFKCLAAGYASIDINNDGTYLLLNLSQHPVWGKILNTNLYRMLPYLISLIVLAFTSKKSRAPKAEGIPYDKGMR